MARGVHDRRIVARYINDRSVVRELFSDIAGRVGTRPGGYTRIVKLGRRRGDNAGVISVAGGSGERLAFLQPVGSSVEYFVRGVDIDGNSGLSQTRRFQVEAR